MNLSSHRLEVPRVARIGSISLFLWALLAAVIWEWKFLPSFNADGVQVAATVDDHILSSGSLLSCGLFILGKLSYVYVSILHKKPG
jgi:hypothetical protein